MFGWDGAALVGQELKILLKEGLDQEVAKFLQQSSGDRSLRVVARRKDGTEFPASVTTLTWSSDTALTLRSGAPSCWTAVFRSLVAGIEPQSSEAPSGQRQVAEAPGSPEAVAALQQETARAARLENELTKLRQEYEQLQRRVTSQGQSEAVAEEGRPLNELDFEPEATVGKPEGTGDGAAGNLASAKMAVDQNSHERNRLESELHAQLSTVRAASKQAESALQEEAARNRAFEERMRHFGNSWRAEQLERSKRFEEAMAAHRRERDDLNARLASEKELAEDSQRRAAETQQELAANAVFLERAGTELSAQTAERESAAAELRKSLSSAETLSRQLEQACSETSQRCKRSEDELLGLRQLREELSSKMMAEQRAAAESKQRAQELEKRLFENTSELERIKFELLKPNRAGRSEMEQAGLRQVREAVNAKLTAEQWQTNEAARRAAEFETALRANATELERVKGERDKLTYEQTRLETDLQAQLEASTIAAAQLDALLQDKAGKCSQLESELTSLQQMRRELGDRLLTEEQTVMVSRNRSDDLEIRLRASNAELARAKAERDKHAQERARLESEWQTQLEAAKATAEQSETARKEEAARNRGIEEQLRRFADKLKQQEVRRVKAFEVQLDNFRQERHEIFSKFSVEQQTGVKLKRRVKELEKQLQDNLESQASDKEELDKASSARGRAEVALRTELAAAKAAAQKAEASCQEKTKQNTRLQEELSSLRQAHDELEAHRNQQRQSTDDSQQRIQELENRLRDSLAELGRAKAALETQTAERALMEGASGHATGNSEELTKELLHLRESEAARGAELAELERRLHDNVATLARVTADLEKERGERRRVEQRTGTLTAQLQELHGNLQQHLESDRSAQERTAQLEQQLHEYEETAARASADLQKEATARQLAEQQLQTTGELISHLRNCVTSFEQAKGGFKRMQEQLESRLQTSRKELNESEAKLQQELTERRRLEEALTTARRSLQEQTESSAIELTKLQSEVQAHQFERQRLEGEAIHSRYASVDSARVGNSMVNSFRRRIRPTLDVLLQSTRGLLEAALTPETKKLAESVLENALLLQSSTQESAPSNVGTPRPSLSGGGGNSSSTEPPPLDFSPPPGLVTPPNVQP